MPADPLLTLLPFAALAAAFVACGDRPRLFVGLAALVLAAWLAAALALASAGPSPLVGAAIVSWSGGLLIAAAVLRRSATLGALSQLAAGSDPLGPMRVEMALRVEELVQLGWARTRGERLEATARGRRIGAATAWVRRRFGRRA